MSAVGDSIVDAMHEIFPLPVLPDFIPDRIEQTGAVPLYVVQRHAAKLNRALRSRESLAALNGLAGARAGAALAPVAPRRAERLNPAQESIVRRVQQRVALHGPRPQQLDEPGAFKELLKTHSIYDGEEGSLREPFDASRLRVLAAEALPYDVMDVAPEHVKRVIRNAPIHIERSTEDIENPLVVTPYWDPSVDPKKKESCDRLIELIQALVKVGLVAARIRRRADIGLFFLRKKDCRLRMVLDARQANEYHRPPPHTSLASVNSLTALDFGDDFRPEHISADDQFYSGSVDLRDGFYQFMNKDLASWFTINLPGPTAAEMGVTTLYDETTGMDRDADPDEFVWACFQGMPMGWTWALWVCHETVSDVMEVAARPRDTVLLDRHVAASLHGDRAVHAPYVDNATVIARNPDVVNDGLKRITGDELDKRGLRWHEHNPADPKLVVLGMVIEGQNWRIMLQPKRAWRMYLGLKFIDRLQVLRGWQMRRIVGHLVSYFGVIRPALACFRACYDFYTLDFEALRKIPKLVKTELAVARGLVFFAAADLAPRVAPFALMSDSSAKGYAVHATNVTTNEIKPLIAAPERARFAAHGDFLDPTTSPS